MAGNQEKRESAEKGGPSPAPPGDPFYFWTVGYQPVPSKKTLGFAAKHPKYAQFSDFFLKKRGAA